MMCQAQCQAFQFFHIWILLIFIKFLGLLCMVIAILFLQWLAFNILCTFSPLIYPVKKRLIYAMHSNGHYQQVW